MNQVLRLGETVFAWVLQTSWQAGVLAIVILAVQALFRRRLSPSWRYGLWLLLIARLLMPVVPPSSLSIFNLARTDLANSSEHSRRPAQVLDTTSPPPLETVDATSRADAASAEESPRDHFEPNVAAPVVAIKPNHFPRIDWLRVSSCAWLVGVFFFASRLVLANLRFRSRIKRHRPIEDEWLTQLFEECRKSFNVTQPVQIVETADVESPGVYGLRLKWLLLPEGSSERLSRDELRHTFLHEMAHLKRRDLEVNWLTAVFQVLHWFNPAIWLAFGRMRADRELAADALALAHIGPMDNLAYGETIIKVAANLAQREAQPGLVGIAESKTGLQERLRAIASAGVEKYWTLAGAGIIAILSIVGLTGAEGPYPRGSAAALGKSSDSSTYSAALFGRVVDAQGRPVNHAQVAICRSLPPMGPWGSPLPSSSDVNLTCAPAPRIFNPHFGHPMADLPRASLPWSFCTTDDRGRFYLNDLDRALGLLAVSERGFGWSTTNGFSTNMTVTLEPWGRIEGNLWHFNEPVTNVSVRVFVADQDGIPWGSGSEIITRTDAKGRFSFDFVPPGHLGVNGAGIGERVIVKSGQTSVAKLGGSGRSVVGKFSIRNPAGEIEAADTLHYVFISSRRDLKAKTMEEWKALRDQPTGENTFTNFHIRPVQCTSDGSFRIDQVEPGKYSLLVETTAMSASTAQGLWFTGWRELEIPARDPKMREPLDMGLIEISLTSVQAAKPPGTDKRSAVKPQQQESSAELEGIKARVIDSQGFPVTNATVSCRGFEWSTTTDALGRFSWPGERQPRTLEIKKEGYKKLFTGLLNPGGEEIILKLEHAILISGKVVEKQTRQPIPAFRVYHVHTLHGPVTPTLYPYESATGSSGTFKFDCGNYFWPDSAFYIDSEGYLPVLSRPLTSADDGKELVFELTRAQPLEGKVLTPEGAPAAKAQINIWCGEANLSDIPRHHVTESDANGAFLVPPVLEGRLLVNDKSGFAEIPWVEFQSNSTVQLSKWGHVKGHWPQPLPSNRKATLQRINWAGRMNDYTYPPPWNVSTTRINPDGSFESEDAVPPGEYMLTEHGSLPINFTGGGSSMAVLISKRVSIKVEPGKASFVEVPAGRSVIGKVGFLDEHSLKNVHLPIVSLHLKQKEPDLKFPPLDPTLTEAQNFDRWKRFRQWMLDYSLSEEGKALRRAERDYEVAADSDGNFRIDNVSPGTYILNINSERWDLKSGPEFQTEVSVSASPDGTPLDLGTLNRATGQSSPEPKAP